MAWNYYRNVRRKTGCSLRLRDLPASILGEAPEGNVVDDVRVVERTKTHVVLQVWSHVKGKFDGQRFTVDVICVPEDPNWIVERP